MPSVAVLQVPAAEGAADRVQSAGDDERRGLARDDQPRHDEGQHRALRRARDERLCLGTR